MTSEFESSRSTDSAEGLKLTPIEQAEQAVMNHIKDAELTSPRFQAFADYVDLQHTEHYLGVHNHEPIDLKMEYALIQETIRQRKNGILGYKKEYEDAEDVAQTLGRAISRKTQNGQDVTPYWAHLGNIKNMAIVEKSQKHQKQ